MKFKDFQAPVLFPSTFKALNLAEKNSSTFKDFQGCVGTLCITISIKHISIFFFWLVNAPVQWHTRTMPTYGPENDNQRISPIFECSCSLVAAESVSWQITSC